MKDIFSLFNEQNPPEQKAEMPTNVVPREAVQELDKVVEKETKQDPLPESVEKKEEPKQEQKEEPKQEQTGGAENEL